MIKRRDDSLTRMGAVFLKDRGVNVGERDLDGLTTRSTSSLLISSCSFIAGRETVSLQEGKIIEGKR